MKKNVKKKMNKKMKENMNKSMYKYLYCALALVFFMPNISLASSLVLSTDKNLLDQSEEFLVSVLIDPKGESVNAIEGKISYATDILDLRQIIDGNSSVTFWLDRPTLDGEVIRYSGFTPGGISGDQKLLMKFIFVGKKKGDGVIKSIDTTVLKNDGLGTKLPNDEGVLKVAISSKVTPKNLQDAESIKDVDPPETFVLSIGKDPDIYDGKYFVAFGTQDKGVGIDYYAVKEGENGQYMRAESPYLLKNQSLGDDIYVKAYDKNGNERVAQILVDRGFPWLQASILTAIIIIASILLRKQILKLFRKKTRGNKHARN